MNILVTAIGSMSADCALPILKESAHCLVGCDIYPYEWLIEANYCDKFYQAPLAREEDKYILFLIEVCMKEKITYLVPLTDIEIDVINKHRGLFAMQQVTLCLPSARVLEVVRNKYKLYLQFKDDPQVPSINSCRLHSEEIDNLSFPCIAKPIDGRSSEGLMRLNTIDELSFIAGNHKYMIQEYKPGNVFTVDYIRCEQTGQDVAIAREELLRTKNGAGLTVRMIQEDSLCELASYIGHKLQLNGCVNMEFIKNGTSFYLIDINPRFSAGIAFTVAAGYDLVTNHLNCFTGKKIDAIRTCMANKIIIKQYKEVIL